MEHIEERQNEILISISTEIAALKSREDLFYVVNTKIKQLFSIDEFGIAQIDEGGQTYSAFVLEFGSKTKEHPEYDRVTSARYSVFDPVFTKVMASDEPILFKVDEVSQQPDMPAYVAFWKSAGFREFLTVPLRVGGVPVGFVNFHFADNRRINPRSILLKGICAQLAVAVSNILAHEKIKAREDEKNLLLSLSNEIALLKNREDLYKVVNRKIKQLFSIKQLGFTTISEDGATYSVFLVDVEEEVRNHPEFMRIITSRYDAHHPLFTTVMNSQEPLEFVVSDLAGQPDMPAYVDFWIKTGIERIATSALRVGGVGIGTALFILEKGIGFNPKSFLLKGVCSQLSVAVFNILANEKIREREEEKTKLLEFSNAMASVRDKQVLGRILKQQLYELFGIEDYVIHILSKDKNFHRPLLYDPDAGFARHPDFLKLTDVDTTIEDGVFNTILAAEDLVTFQVEDWLNSPQRPACGNAAKSVDVKNMAGIAIRLGNENIAVMNFRKEGISELAIERPLFKSICSQIAIAVSNIAANDEITRQLIEIERYREQLEEEKIYLKEEIEISQNYSEIIGESLKMKKVFRLIEQVAHSDSTVLLLGETGTGKELIARAIHNASPRKDKLMIKVNCAAMPANLIESELFGHERGSFTGALDRRIGKFELANKGTLFLDEIGEMPLELQVKLLRALQEKEIERIGGKTTIRTDVRIIAATNRDLENLMEEGKFRNDLYYRLNIFPIKLPPLRERREDIPVLTAYFLERYSKREGKKITSLSSRVLHELQNYVWPGNIRELEHWVERSVLLASGSMIKEAHLPNRRSTQEPVTEPEEFKIRTIFENEKEYILKVLQHVNGRISGEGGAAELLGIPPSTLNSRIKKLGIRKEHRG